MASILVSGLINLETTLQVEGFPLAYSPVNFPFFGVRSTMSGVGLNISLAFKMLGDNPIFLSVIGVDMAGRLAMDEIQRHGLETSCILPLVKATAQSVILYEASGRRQIHVDLKDIQETTYPENIFRERLAQADLAVLCNINFSRPMLAIARQAGIPIATDLHTISRLDDPYELDFLQAADILFMSHEKLPDDPEAWVMALFQRCPCRVLGIGMGERGALLCERGKRPRLYPAVAPRGVVNTIGAGDALFACFIHYYIKLGDAAESMRRAVVFAGYKASFTGAAEGFLAEAELESMLDKIPQ